MIISAQTIRKYQLITPFHERTVFNGMSFGLSSCGYDVRIAQDVLLTSWFNKFQLASTVEHFNMPDFIVGRVCDKSTWARQGLAVQNTIIEPGWRGHLTLELSLNAHGRLRIKEGDPIAQIMFELLDKPTNQPYTGKYQDQEDRPVSAKTET